MENKDIVDSLVGIIKETEEQDKMLQSQNVGWRKELRERFDWTQNTTIKGKVELEKFIQELLDKAREEVVREIISRNIDRSLDIIKLNSEGYRIASSELEILSNELKDKYLN